jgi:hypothetical protein
MLLHRAHEVEEHVIDLALAEERGELEENRTSPILTQ